MDKCRFYTGDVVTALGRGAGVVLSVTYAGKEWCRVQWGDGLVESWYAESLVLAKPMRAVIQEAADYYEVITDDLTGCAATERWQSG